MRALAIIITVGSGAPMGTEAPAAHLGVATGSWLGQLRPGRQQLLRGAAVAGGAAGVSALMGVALVGTAFILELGRRRRVPLTPARVTAALIGGLIGWGINLTFDLDLIRLITPMVPPDGWLQVLRTCLYVGVIAGFLTALTGWAIYRVRGWTAGPTRRLVIGAGAMLAATLTLLLVADGRSAVGPGGGAILWAESPVGLAAPASLLLLVAALRAAATTAAVAAGGCGGVFVPFLAIGDLAGRSFAPTSASRRPRRRLGCGLRHRRRLPLAVDGRRHGHRHRRARPRDDDEPRVSCSSELHRHRHEPRAATA